MTGKKIKIKIGNKVIGNNCPVFVIAEIGCNFEGDIKRAKEMIRVASEAGIDAVKFQTFVPSKLTSKHAKKFWEIEGCPGKTQLEEFMQMPRLTLKQYQELKKTADKHGIIFFSTPCDEGSVDLLEQINVPLYKVSSMDITHIPLLKYIARKGKPVVISTGASTITEIREAVKAAEEEGNKNIALLHCISNYPAKDTDVNLRMIAHLKEAFPKLPVGYSDHTIPKNGEGILSAAVALGAVIIEKHFTFDNTRPGYDHEISIDYGEAKQIVTQIRRVENALGSHKKKPVGSEVKARLHARRSVVADVFIAKGSFIKKNMLSIKRPATGIAPKFIAAVIGLRAKRDIKEDDAIKWDMLDGQGKA